MLYLAVLREFNVVEVICTLAKPFNASATDKFMPLEFSFKMPSIKNRERGLNYSQVLLCF